MASSHRIQKAPNKNGLATILAIGTANPQNIMYQTDYPDFYFRMTNSEHMIDLKAKFKRICEKSIINKRYMHISEEMLKQNPHMTDYNATSLDTRQVFLATEVPKLGKEAAEKAIEEWGQPKSSITHLIFATNSTTDVPGADVHFMRLLGLQPSVKRFLVLHGGCNAGCTALRLAKDIAENNRGSRVLVVCSESTAISFLAPTITQIVPHAIFGDGAGAMVVGTDPNEPLERPIFQLFSTNQTTLPDTQGAITAHLREIGMIVQLKRDVPNIISNNIKKVVIECFKPIGIDDWNSIFHVVHPGGRAILDQIEDELGLEKSKFSASRHVLSEFGNMWGASVIFELDEMRKKSSKEGKGTTGEGLDWGLLLGFGPGLTIETIVLRSVPLNN